jgi:hypothetical protein
MPILKMSKTLMCTSNRVYRRSQCGQPPPLQRQPPLEQLNVHGPSHTNVQPPPEQLKSQVAPPGHHAEQSPPEQSRVHGTCGAQSYTHLPPEQSSVQLDPESQTMSHRPPEQLTLHGAEFEHVPEQAPLEQSHAPDAVQLTGVSFVPGGIGSGRFGRLLHATTTKHANATSFLMRRSYTRVHRQRSKEIDARNFVAAGPAVASRDAT